MRIKEWGGCEMIKIWGKKSSGGKEIKKRGIGEVT
jgi:hypothetical protein